MTGETHKPRRLLMRGHSGRVPLTLFLAIHLKAIDEWFVPFSFSFERERKSTNISSMLVRLDHSGRVPLIALSPNLLHRTDESHLFLVSLTPNEVKEGIKYSHVLQARKIGPFWKSSADLVDIQVPSINLWVICPFAVLFSSWWNYSFHRVLETHIVCRFFIVGHKGRVPLIRLLSKYLRAINK